MTTVEVYPDKAGKYRWRITARNGEIIAASSQGFFNIKTCQANVNLVAVAFSNFVVRYEPSQ